jgi:hypothetical protein
MRGHPSRQEVTRSLQRLRASIQGFTLCDMTQPNWPSQQPSSAPVPPIVVNLPPPTIIMQPPPPKARATGWALVWSIAMVAGPALTAVAALIIALLSFNASHDANKLTAKGQAAADSAARKHDAQLVSWIIDQSDKSVTIVNSSDTPLFSPTFYWEHIPETGPGIIGISTELTYSAFAPNGSLPACSQMTFHLGKPPAQATWPRFYDGFFTTFTFRNRDGLWYLSPTNVLGSGPATVSNSDRLKNSWDVLARLISTGPAPTCSP